MEKKKQIRRKGMSGIASLVRDPDRIIRRKIISICDY